MALMLNTDRGPLSHADNALSARPAVIWALLVLLTLGGAVLRVHDLGTASLWKDEINQAQMSAMPVNSIFEGLQSVENDMPLDFLVQHMVLKIAPQGDVWVRFHAMVFGILSIPLAFALLFPLIGPTASLFATALLAVSPFHLHHSQEGRPYALMFLLTVVSSCALWRLIKGDKRRALWGGLYLISALANVWTHLIAAAVIACQQFWVVSSLGWGLREKGENRRPLVLASGWSLGVAALAALSILPVLNRVTGGELGDAGAPFTPLDWDLTLRYLTGFTFGREEFGHWFSAGYIGGPLALLGLVWGLRKRPEATWFLICVGPAVVVLVLALCWYREHWFSLRYVLVAMLPFLAFVSLGVICLVELCVGALVSTPSKRSGAVLVSLGLITLAVSVSASAFLWKHPAVKRDWRGASEWITSNLDLEDTLLITRSDWRRLRYYIDQTNWMGMAEVVSSDDLLELDPQDHTGKYVFLRSSGEYDDLRERLSDSEEMISLHRLQIVRIDE